MERYISILGLFVLLGILYLFSHDRKKIAWRTVLSGVLLQILLCVLILKVPLGRTIFDWIGQRVVGLLGYANEGTAFLFGPLADSAKTGFVFAIMIIGTIIFVSSLMSILYHVGIMQIVIRAMAFVMVRVMGTSGAESLAAAANVFAGQTEAPLVVKPYIDKMTSSEILALMTGGMATIAGGVLAAYVSFGIDAGHLLAASVMSAPAALLCAKMVLPEKEESLTKGVVKLDLPKTADSVIDAAATGASEGMKLAINVGAMLIAFIALVALCNGMLTWAGSFAGISNLTLEMICGYLFAPVAFIMGVPWVDSMAVGTLLGKKLILNEFVAYLDLKEMMTTLEPRSVIIATYALCGFSNIGSIAIQIGGIGALAPGRKGELAKQSLRALFAGTVACLMTACVAGIFI